uniref:recombinase RecT n=1 Tax=Escherichia coli TaxID=562 RepID=UPI00201D222E
QPSGKNIIRWLLKKRTNGSVRYCQYTSQIELVRSQSKAGNNGPWVTHWEEMAKKTAIRRLFKYLPVSIEIQRAVSMDEKEPLTIDPADSSVLTGEYSVIDNSEE